MNLSECMSDMNAWMKRCMCGCFCMTIIFMQIPEDSFVAGWVITFVWLCMTVWIILHNEWISCEWSIIICEWLCAFDSVTMIRLCMVLAGWLAVWLHAFISSCYFMFNHLYICNWVWEFAFGSVYGLMQSGVTARHVCQAISRSIGKGILCNIMPSYHFYAMIYHDLLCCTFAPGCVLRFLCVMITWLSWIHMGIYCTSTWACLHV